MTIVDSTLLSLVKAYFDGGNAAGAPAGTVAMDLAAIAAFVEKHGTVSNR